MNLIYKQSGHCIQTHMTENQKDRLDQILSRLKGLENEIQILKHENVVPFSFYRESFDATQEIARLLHNMEFLQIQAMKSEMETLIGYLSELKSMRETSMPAETETEKGEPDEIVETRMEEAQEEASAPAGEPGAPADAGPQPFPDAAFPAKPRTSPAIDIKQLFTLNDRYLFQRELFHNNRKKMESFMLILNTFDSSDEAERYIRDNTPWNFNDETVKSFVAIVKKGFE